MWKLSQSKAKHFAFSRKRVGKLPGGFSWEVSEPSCSDGATTTLGRLSLMLGLLEVTQLQVQQDTKLGQNPVFGWVFCISVTSFRVPSSVNLKSKRLMLWQQQELWLGHRWQPTKGSGQAFHKQWKAGHQSAAQRVIMAVQSWHSADTAVPSCIV